MTDIQEAERILRDRIYEAASHGLISESEADELNEELQDLLASLEAAHEENE